MFSRLKSNPLKEVFFKKKKKKNRLGRSIFNNTTLTTLIKDAENKQDAKMVSFKSMGFSIHMCERRHIPSGMVYTDKYEEKSNLY